MSWGDPLWTFYWWHVSLHRSECCSEAVLVSSFSLSQMVIGLLGATGPITISSRLCWSQSHCFSQASSLIPPPYLHLSLFLKKIYFSLMCECMCTCVWMPVEARRSQMPWNWNSRQVWATKPGSWEPNSTRAENVLNCRATFPGPVFFFSIFNGES